MLQLPINGFKKRQHAFSIVLCPKQRNKIEGVVLNRVCVLRIFCFKQGQGFKPSTQILVKYLPQVITIQLF